MGQDLFVLSFHRNNQNKKKKQKDFFSQIKHHVFILQKANMKKKNQKPFLI